MSEPSGEDQDSGEVQSQGSERGQAASTGPAQSASTGTEPTAVTRSKHHTTNRTLPSKSTIVQLVCIVAVAGVAIFDVRSPGESVPAIVYGTLLGVALGIDPMSFLKGLGGK